MDIKSFLKPTTILVVIAFLIIGLYALTEVNYFSYKNVAESNEVNASVIIILILSRSTILSPFRKDN